MSAKVCTSPRLSDVSFARYLIIVILPLICMCHSVYDRTSRKRVEKNLEVDGKEVRFAAAELRTSVTATAFHSYLLKTEMSNHVAI